MSADNRTERATARRRQKARERGQVLRARELAATLSLLSAILFLASDPQAWVGRWHMLFGHCLTVGLAGNWDGNLPALQWAGLAAVEAAAPVLLVAFAVAVLATLAQGGIVFSTEAFAPDWNRLNPANNLKHLFSFAGISRICRSMFPVGAILYLAWGLLQERLPAILHSTRLSARGVLSLAGSLSFELAWKFCLVLLAWAVADFAMQWYAHEQSLKMTKQEVRDEAKDTEGNPLIRGRIRKLRRERMRRSLEKDVQRATAVITNPTHYAVALEYRPEVMAAPVVVAKGRDLLAQRIKQLARWHEIPIVENPPLAQALYQATEVGQAIPPKLYAAVAEILAFLYRAQLRMQAQSAGSAERRA
jgi:flagellar biosynthetic protein FlhB